MSLKKSTNGGGGGQHLRLRDLGVNAARVSELATAYLVSQGVKLCCARRDVRRYFVGDGAGLDPRVTTAMNAVAERLRRPNSTSPSTSDAETVAMTPTPPPALPSANAGADDAVNDDDEKAWGSDYRVGADAYNPYLGKPPKDLVEAARVIDNGDAKQAEQLIAAAAEASLSAVEDGQFARALGKRAAITPGDVKKQLASARAKIKEKCPLTPEELVAEAARLWAEAEPLAMQSDIIGHAVQATQLAGVVGEVAAIGATYIAMSSRVLAEERVVSVLRTGVASAGKSHLAGKVEALMPPECIVSVTSGSPRALVYMVAHDPDALRHKIVMLHETAGYIAANDKDNNPSGAVVRELLTRGRADYPYVDRDGKGKLVSARLVAEGPISLITTSARDNLDPEMLDRLIAIPTNESPKATRAIQIAQLSGGAEKNFAEARHLAEQHWAHQRWLQSQAPLRVVIPEDLRRSIMGALGQMPVTVRTRRDVPAFLLAVKASAAIYAAQRKCDAEGRLIAQIEDYVTAHAAFDAFIARGYASELKPEEVAVLAVVETLIDNDRRARAVKEKAWQAAMKPAPAGHIPSSEARARISYDMIAAKLQMRSRDTLAKRVKALKTAGAIAIDRDQIGQMATWELLTPTAQVKTARSGQFMPTILDVEVLFSVPLEREKRIADLTAAAGMLPDWSE
jgi:hypothetical protein